MTPEEFQKKAMAFAVYEQSIYPFIALAEEAGEVSGKIAKFIRKNNVGFEDAIAMAAGNKTKLGKELHSALKDELSDVYWNICACLHELKTPISKAPIIDLISYMCPHSVFPTLQHNASLPYLSFTYCAYNTHYSVQEAFKLIPNKIEKVILKEIEIVYESLFNCCTVLNITLEQLGEHNIAKLAGRKERNTIKGSGDNR